MTDSPGGPGRAAADGKRGWWLRGSVAVAGVAFAGVLVLLSEIRQLYSGDTEAMIRSAHAILACAREGVWVRCPGVTHYPPAQFLLALAALTTGHDDQATYTLLVRVSLVAYLATLAVTLRLLRGRPDGRLALAVAGLVGSFAVNYAVTPFGEMLAVCLGVGLVAALQLRSGPLTALAATLFCLTKDVAAPVALLLGLAALPAVTGEAWGAWARRNRRPMAWLAAGCLLGAAGSAAFNELRYGSLQNTHLLNPRFQVQHLDQQLLHFIALFVSPSAGLLVTAPLLLLTLGAVAFGARAQWRRPEGLRGWVPLAVVLGTSAGLAAWYTPFGWWAWGPRLSLPWLVPAFVLAVSAMPPGALGTRGFALAALLTTPLVVLNSAMLGAPARMFSFFERHVCAGEVNSDPFFACSNRVVFSLSDSLTLHVAQALREPWVLALAGLHLAVVLGCLLTRGGLLSRAS
jgi:hypothetical protein